jgi:hypothetical protein
VRSVGVYDVLGLRLLGGVLQINDGGGWI